MIKLTKVQFETLEYIRHFTNERKFPPSRAEIAGRFGIAQNAANDHVLALESKGALKIVPGQARGIVDLNERIEVAA